MLYIALWGYGVLVLFGKMNDVVAKIICIILMLYHHLPSFAVFISPLIVPIRDAISMLTFEYCFLFISPSSCWSILLLWWITSHGYVLLLNMLPMFSLHMMDKYQNLLILLVWRVTFYETKTNSFEWKIYIYLVCLCFRLLYTYHE